MSYKSLVEGLTIEDPKTDRKNSICFDRYHAGEQAVYLDHLPHDKYIPYAAVKRVWCQSSQYNGIGACGKGFPVFLVCVEYNNGLGETKLQKYMFEFKEPAEKMADYIKEQLLKVLGSGDVTVELSL